MAFSITVLRPLDLLTFEVTAENLRLDTSDAAHPALIAEEATRPAWLAITLPPQTIAEAAFFESSAITPDANPSSAPQPDPPSLPLPAPGSPAAGATTVAVLGHPSRLVFDVPAGARIPFTVEGLADWQKLALRLNPIAAIPPDPTPAQIAAAPAPAEPTADQTAIEMPWRLWISPDADAAFASRAGPRTSRGRTELWHARLVLRPTQGKAAAELSAATPAPLRAIWSPDYTPAAPPPPDTPSPFLGLTAMVPNDRYQLVVLTSAFSGWEVEREVTLHIGGRPVTILLPGPFVPQPIEATELLLTPFGGYLISRGAWTPPFPTPPRRPFPNLHDIFDLNVDLPRAPAVARAIPAPLDLSEWDHRATLGRDHYVRLVYEGELWPFRHPASLIKVTERQFRPTPDGAPGAYLIQHLFIVVRDPVRNFGDADFGMPLKQVTLRTLVTPELADPEHPFDPATRTGIITGTQRSFWVAVGPAGQIQRFSFNAGASDADGRPVDFTLPLLFVSSSDVATAAASAAALAEYNNLANAPPSPGAATGSLLPRSASVPGQKIALAGSDPDPTKRTDNTLLVTDLLDFVLDQDISPALLQAQVKIPQIQELLGTDTPVTIGYVPAYRSGGFQGVHGLFAQLSQLDASSYSPTNPFAAIVPNATLASFTADKAGGIATPNLMLSTLTRALGPLAGSAAEAATDNFNPASFFPPGSLAQLFGSFDLASLIPAGTMGENAPKLSTTTQDVPGGKLVVTTIDFKPAVQPIDLGIVKFTPKAGTTKFTIHGVIQKPVSLAGAAGAPTFEFDGTLTDFTVEILSSVAVAFSKFEFLAKSGQKPDVSVALDPANPITFEGDLAFVEALQNAIPPGLFGDGPSLDITPAGVEAGFAIALPPIAVGVFALQSVALGAGITLPFVDGKPTIDFNVSTRPHPFSLTVAFFGGGGFFHLQLDTAGMRELEAALEFGAAAAIDLGVASGEVHIMAGIYFSLQRQSDNNLRATLTGYLRLGGSLSVLGIITVSVEFNLSFTYQSVGKAYGRATLTVEVDVLFFHKSVELTVERTFAGQSGDPKFSDFFNTPESWHEYAAAFA